VIVVEIERDRRGEIVRFRATGHSLFRKKGEDIVCSAVSALLQTSVIGLKTHLGIELEVEKGDGFLSVSVDGVGEEVREGKNAVLETMYLGLRSIESEYGNYLKVDETCA
jgi:hypothetical protein